jgi:hypothetical protein
MHFYPKKLAQIYQHLFEILPIFHLIIHISLFFLFYFGAFQQCTLQLIALFAIFGPCRLATTLTKWLFVCNGRRVGAHIRVLLVASRNLVHIIFAAMISAIEGNIEIKKNENILR